MSIYVITGGTTGIGAATREKLQEQGHEVFNIDYKGGDYTADLSTKEGRKGAIEAVYQRYPDGIDCFISNAGVGPTVPAATLFSLNYFAATELAEGLQPLLKKKRGNCVMTASNSITFPYVRQDWVLQHLKTCLDPLDAPCIAVLGSRRHTNQCGSSW